MCGKLSNEAYILYYCYPHFVDGENRFKEMKSPVQVTHGVNDRNGNLVHIFWLPSHFHQTMNTKKQLANVNAPLAPYKVEPKMSFYRDQK